jgi:anaerobic dimethyl sulfoxide reductase subunit B (iron-sulfur subunit)
VSREIDRYAYSIRICRHCADPECYDACPVEGAMRRDDAGVVHIVQDECISCGACMEACPFQGVYQHSGLGIYLKCDMCRGFSDGPLCAIVCPTEALSLAGGQGVVA